MKVKNTTRRKQPTTTDLAGSEENQAIFLKLPKPFMFKKCLQYFGQVHRRVRHFRSDCPSVRPSVRRFIAPALSLEGRRFWP